MTTHGMRVHGMSAYSMNEQNTKLVLLIGRIIAGLFYILAGVNNFVNLSSASGYAAFKGVPMPALAVMAASSLLVIGGVSILTGYQPVLGVSAIVLFLLPVTLIMHNFWSIDEAQAQVAEVRSFLSNMGLIGSTLIFLAVPRPWLGSIDEIFE
jgi:putative oxidoreductase